MSICGTLLVVITASILKPLLSSNQSFDLPAVALYDRSNDVLPYEDSDLDPDDKNNFFLALNLPASVASPKDADLDIKRQFDPWGGKRYSLFLKDAISGKRQFSPWGGKRSNSESTQADDKGTTDAEDNQAADSIILNNKRNFNSWNKKLGSNSSGGKRNSNTDDIKRMFKLWEGKKNLDLWDEKRNFNAWGGKRFVKSLQDGSDDSYIGNENAKLSGKRQAFNSWGGKRGFNSWGGKRGFNSWGGKRSFNSWGGKRVTYTDPDVKEFR